MEILKRLFNGKGYIDGITIINMEGEILFTAKLNSKLQNQDDAYELLGRNFLEVYENLTPENSSTIRAMELGVPVYVENQFLQTKGREGITITSLSIPIKSGNRVVGAIDLSTQEGDEEAEAGSEVDTESAFQAGSGSASKSGSKVSPTSVKLDLDSANFPVRNANKLVKKNMAVFSVGDIIAVDERMQKARDYIRVVAACDLPVMIYGETGTGKEMFAQAIHNAGTRKNKPFIAQNCAAIPETLLESILFGTAKGAFTGSVDNKGLFELADGGTLFLDEINSMPIHLQSKLLRVLQDGYFRSLGAKENKAVDVKIIAALNMEPLAAIREGQLRRDIYYRLSTMSIRIPPLRERKKDISHFIQYYINKHNATFGKNVQYISKELLEKMEDYEWPGNVRELEHIIIYGMSVVKESSGTLRFEDVEERFQEITGKSDRLSEPGQAACSSLKMAVEAYEKEIIRQTLLASGGNFSKAARILDVPRQTLQRKANQYGIRTEKS